MFCIESVGPAAVHSSVAAVPEDGGLPPKAKLEVFPPDVPPAPPTCDLAVARLFCSVQEVPSQDSVFTVTVPVVPPPSSART